MLRGSGFGDIVVVVTRYFGGTKLGRGGLVRAYGDAVRAGLEALPKAQKVRCDTLMAALPYPLLEPIRRLVLAHQGLVLDELFAADITLTVRFASTKSRAFQEDLIERTHGQVQAEVVIEQEETLFPIPSP